MKDDHSESECAICQQAPQDMLIVSCSHNLCIECATQVFALSGKDNIFTCEICLAQTQLDHQTTSFLRNAMSKPTAPQANTKHKSLSTSQAPKTTIPVSPRCPHHNETSLYHCFTCQDSTLCCECVLSHQSHDLLTLKKAFARIASHQQQYISTLQRTQQTLAAKINELSTHRHSLQHTLSHKLTTLKEYFDSLLRLVSQRYCQLASELEVTYSRKTEMMEGAMEAVHAQHDALAHTITRVRDCANTLNWTTPDPLDDISIAQLPSVLPQDDYFFRQKGVQGQIRDILTHLDWACGPQPMLTQTNLNHPKKTKRELSSTNKLDLSRSIHNANTIISKIQQRIKLF